MHCLIRVLDVMSIGVETLTFVIKSGTTNQIFWAGSFREFVRDLSMFHFFYAQEVLKYDVDNVKERQCVIIYI